MNNQEFISFFNNLPDTVSLFIEKENERLEAELKSDSYKTEVEKTFVEKLPEVKIPNEDTTKLNPFDRFMYYLNLNWSKILKKRVDNINSLIDAHNNINYTGSTILISEPIYCNN